MTRGYSKRYNPRESAQFLPEFLFAYYSARCVRRQIVQVGRESTAKAGMDLALVFSCIKTIHHLVINTAKTRQPHRAVCSSYPFYRSFLWASSAMRLYPSTRVTHTDNSAHVPSVASSASTTSAIPSLRRSHARPSGYKMTVSVDQTCSSTQIPGSQVASTPFAPGTVSTSTAPPNCTTITARAMATRARHGRRHHRGQQVRISSF